MKGRFGHRHMNDEEIKPEHGEHRLHDDLRRAKPIFHLAPVEHELQRAKTETERGKTDPVEFQCGAAAPLAQKQCKTHDPEDAERHIDEKYPPPIVDVGKVAAQCRAKKRSDHHAHSPKRHGGATLFQRIEIEHGRSRQWYEPGAECALQQAEHHHLIKDFWRDRRVPRRR